LFALDNTTGNHLGTRNDFISLAYGLSMGKTNLKEICKPLKNKHIKSNNKFLLCFIVKKYY